jgi:uncharacterized protein YyaL (SSP411 family)
MNRLATETSLYLRQHADNPVAWYPWGPEAIAVAKESGKPIFLSVGYSACHWCHVMAHESFEDASTAAVMNEHFINIKVDREERPDLDQIYMAAHGMLTRDGGGWPLSVWLTPELKPFYAGTYFPPKEMYGRPSFRRVLLAIAQSWHASREKLEEVGAAVVEQLQSVAEQADEAISLTPDLLEHAARTLNRAFDSEYGGFGNAPKFPHALDMQLLLRTKHRFGRAEDEHVVRTTLERMARGGIFDQIGGGFHRYSVDRQWLVPHFEKMLYDNAQLVPAYLELFQMTGDPVISEIVRETLDYILREMTSTEGGFFSTQDADSEGVEGKFFVWSEEELDRVLTADEATFAKRVFGTSAHGNFEGRNILYRWRSDADEAEGQGLTLDAFQSTLRIVKQKLLIERSKRVWPGRDEKILTSWNGLMIHALALAGSILNEPRYWYSADAAAQFVLKHLRGPGNRLFRTCGIGQPAKLTGYLDDYSFFTHALLTLYEATFNPRWLNESMAIADAMIHSFSDPRGGFFYTADDHDTLPVRMKDIHDGSIPSGNATAALALLRLSHFTSRPDYREVAERTILFHRSQLAEHPMASAQMLIALDFLIGPVDEIVIAGHRDDPETEQILRALRSRFHPTRVIVCHDPADGPVSSSIPLLTARTMIDGRTTVYQCRDRVCSAPIVGAVPHLVAI